MLLLQGVMNTLNAHSRELLEQEMMEYLRTKGWGPISENTQQQQQTYEMPNVEAFKYSICRTSDNPTRWATEHKTFSKLKEDYNWSSKWDNDVVFCVMQDKIIVAKAIVNKKSKVVRDFMGNPMWENFIKMNLFN